MTISSELEILKTNLQNSYTSAANKGAILPQVQSFSNLSATIATITGSSSNTYGIDLAYEYTENLLNTQEVFLLHEVLCEMVYVLDGVYKTSRKDINKQLSALLDFVTIEDSDVMKNALQFYADTRLDFVDCILLSYFKTNNIQVATFDKKLKNKMK